MRGVDLHVNLDTINPYKQTLRKLTNCELRVFVGQLSKPLSIWMCENARFEVYRAKDLLNPLWPSNTLRRILIDARGSYYVYGDRPPLDEYDAKSASYLVRAIYPVVENGRKNMVEEWTSDRLVPLSGLPPGSGELEFFTYEGIKMSALFQNRFFDTLKPQANYRMFTVTSNRLCGIPPYHTSESCQERGSQMSERLRYTGISYVLMCKHFCEDYLDISEALYSTSIIHERVLKKSMTFSKKDALLSVKFAPAHALFDLEDPALIRLDRHAHENAAYHFPGYFLDIYSLSSLLQRLLTEEKISPKTIYYYGLAGQASGGVKSDFEFKKMPHLGRLLTVNGRLKHASITGECLREFVDKEVLDGPMLRITLISDIRANTDEIIESLGILKCS